MGQIYGVDELFDSPPSTGAGGGTIYKADELLDEPPPKISGSEIETGLAKFAASFPGGKQMLAARLAFRGEDSSFPGFKGDQEKPFADRYLAARKAVDERVEALDRDNPNSGTIGTGFGIVTQILATGGVSALKALGTAVKNPGAALRGLGSLEGLAQAAGGAARGVGPGAAFGAASSDADIPLAQGDLPGAAQELGRGAARGAAIGAGVGGVLGAQSAGLSARAAAAQEAATAAQQGGPEAIARQEADAAFIKAENATGREAVKLQNEAAELRRKADLVQLKHEADVEARAPSREKAVAMFGADDVGSIRQLGGGPEAEATLQRIYDEPVPGQREVTYGEMRGNSTAKEWEQLITKVKGQVGEQLGALREEIGNVPNTFRAGKSLLEQARSFVKEVPNAEQAQALETLEGIVKRYGTGPNLRLDMGTVRNVVDDIRSAGDFSDGQLGRFYTQTYRAATALEKSMIAQRGGAQALSKYNEILGQASDLYVLERGAKRLGERAAIHPGEDPVRWPKPREVTVADVAKARFVPKPVPAPIGKVAQEKAQEALAARLSLPKALGRRAVETIVGSVGTGMGYATGGPILASSMAGPSYFAGRSLGRAWFKAVRPSTADLIGESEAADRVFQRLGPAMNAALRAGGAAANALHRALIKSDAEYRGAFGDAPRRPLDDRPLSWEDYLAQ